MARPSPGARIPVRLRAGGHRGSSLELPSSRKWRNWQTHQLEGLAVAIPWGFESPLSHHHSLRSFWLLKGVLGLLGQRRDPRLGLRAASPLLPPSLAARAPSLRSAGSRGSGFSASGASRASAFERRVHSPLASRAPSLRSAGSRGLGLRRFAGAIAALGSGRLALLGLRRSPARPSRSESPFAPITPGDSAPGSTIGPRGPRGPSPTTSQGIRPHQARHWRDVGRHCRP